MKKSLFVIALMLAIVCMLASCNIQIGKPSESTSSTIEISEDGYWVINGEKTDVKAQGEKGEQGIQGEKGDKGDKGDSATATDENPLGLAFFPKDDGTYVVEIGYAKYLSKIEIPATYNGKAVTEVRNFASDTLKEIIIPDSVTTIGNEAFDGCNNLTTATMPTTAIFAIPKAELTTVFLTSGVSIGDYAFYGYDSLTSVTIPDSVTTIGDYAFDGCDSLTSVTIPDSVTSIGDYAFCGCDSLTSVTIPDSVTSIGDYAFCGCTSLTSILVDSDNTAYQSIDGNLYSKDGKTLIAYAIGKTDTSFTIPNSVTTIGASAFSDCTSLTSVTIGDGVMSIGNWAFSYCTSLTSVTIPNSVTSIGGFAFYGCDSLTSVTIPDSVTSIGDSAFERCTSLTSVTIGDSVMSIGEWAFHNCNSLTNVTFVNPNGWVCGDVFNATNVFAISASDLSNPATAAQYLKSTYFYYYWFRTE